MQNKIILALINRCLTNGGASPYQLVSSPGPNPRGSPLSSGEFAACCSKQLGTHRCLREVSNTGDVHSNLRCYFDNIDRARKIINMLPACRCALIDVEHPEIGGQSMTMEDSMIFKSSSRLRFCFSSRPARGTGCSLGQILLFGKMKHRRLTGCKPPAKRRCETSLGVRQSQFNPGNGHKEFPTATADRLT